MHGFPNVLVINKHIHWLAETYLDIHVRIVTRREKTTVRDFRKPHQRQFNIQNSLLVVGNKYCLFHILKYSK